MNLLNSKLIMECDEFEEQKHNEEIQKIYNKFYQLPNIDCALVISNSTKKESKIEICKMHDVFDFVERFDFKNGIDIYNDDDFITFVLNGKTYEKNNELNIFFTFIKILPLDANGNPVKVYIG